MYRVPTGQKEALGSAGNAPEHTQRFIAQTTRVPGSPSRAPPRWALFIRSSQKPLAHSQPVVQHACRVGALPGALRSRSALSGPPFRHCGSGHAVRRAAAATVTAADRAGLTGRGARRRDAPAPQRDRVMWWISKLFSLFQGPYLTRAQLAFILSENNQLFYRFEQKLIKHFVQKCRRIAIPQASVRVWAK
jgi:hypothetical protein